MRTSTLPTQYSVEYIGPALLPRVWDKLEIHLARILKHAPEFSLKDLESYILAGDSTCYALLNRDGQIVGALVLELVKYPRETEVLVWGVSGEHYDEAVGVVEAAIKRYALLNKCTRIKAWTRHGLREKLRQRGWRHISNVMELAV